jgi:hypothetical protein
MKVILIASLICSSAIAASGPKKEVLTKKEIEAIKRGKKLPEKKEEDCDEKAKKPIEIKPETISLGGNAGCTLDEAH